MDVRTEKKCELYRLRWEQVELQDLKKDHQTVKKYRV